MEDQRQAAKETGCAGDVQAVVGDWAGELADQLRSDPTLADVCDPRKRKLSDVRLRGEGHDIKGKILAACGSNFNGSIEQQGRLIVGRYCAFGSGLTSLGGQHRTDTVNLNIRLQRELGFQSNHLRGRATFVGHNVWAGSNVTLLGGVRIGSGAVLGTGAVITKDVPPFAIAVGVAAKIKGYRFLPSVIEQILTVAWWNWDRDRMLRNREFFEVNIPRDRHIDLLSLIVP